MAVKCLQWVGIKSPRDIALEGVDVEIDWTDDHNINSVIIRDSKGNALRVIKGEYSGMRAMVPATAEKYKVKGTALGIDVDQTFDDEQSANSHRSRILDACPDAQLAVEKVKVPTA